jgi:hypothetical protein
MRRQRCCWLDRVSLQADLNIVEVGDVMWMTPSGLIHRGRLVASVHSRDINKSCSAASLVCHNILGAIVLPGVGVYQRE